MQVEIARPILCLIMPTIDDVAPDKASYRPGEAAIVTVSVFNELESAVCGRLALALSHLDEVVAEFGRDVELQSQATATLSFTLTPPTTPLRGYGLDVTLYSEVGGSVLAEGSGALDVLERWSQAPRYGFLSDFGPEQARGDDVAARCSSLCRYHLNVVQFYDWMWRHYKLLPPASPGSPAWCASHASPAPASSSLSPASPASSSLSPVPPAPPKSPTDTDEEEFTDAMGRRLSLGSVRASIAGVQVRGGAAMAYGAVYGAEPEFAEQHPELCLYDEDGKPVSLAELFYIMNIDPASQWVPLIVSEFAEAVRRLDFDGIHLDQYGFPRTARDAWGKVVDLAACFPTLIDKARRAVVEEKAGAGVIFNAVENWPIETVAQTSQDAVYIEVWPPYETYNDLRGLISEGKRLSGGKQVVLAAYLSPFLDAREEDVPRAEAAALLATAAIAASGGFHLLLGERDGILCDPYYPKYATLRPEFALRMRAYYDFLVRYEELILASDVDDYVDGIEDWRRQASAAASAGSTALSAQAESGAVWAIHRHKRHKRHKPGYHVVHLLNLAEQRDILWNALRTPPRQITDLEVRLRGLPPVQDVLAVSPDAHMGRPISVRWRQQDGEGEGNGGGLLYAHLPPLHVWTVLICKLEADADADADADPEGSVRTRDTQSPL